MSVDTVALDPTPPPPKPRPLPPDLTPEQVDHLVDGIMVVHLGRRLGLVRALTVDSDALFAMVTPHGEAMSLTATLDGAWQYGPSPEALPPCTPDPACGINWAAGPRRRRHHKTDWLAYVAAHSDAWLVAQAMHQAAQHCLGAAGRAALFARINPLPTLYEEVRAWTRPGGGGGRPAGTTEPPPPGPFLARSEVTRALRGRVGYIYHPGDDRWYVGTFTRVAPSLGTADVRFVRGGTETVAVLGLVDREHVVMIT